MEAKTELILEILVGLKEKLNKLEARLEKVERGLTSLNKETVASAIQKPQETQPSISAGEALAKLRNTGAWKEFKSIREQFLEP